MSEGEFKKRYSSFVVDDEKTIPNPKTVMQWIDEARKEFPKKKDVTTVGGDGEEYSSEEYDSEEVDKWVLKWFGEKE